MRFAKTRLPQCLRGPGVRRDRPRKTLLARARRFRKGYDTTIHVIGTDGRVKRAPADVEEELWRNRWAIWATKPAPSPAAAALLHHYFQERFAHMGGEQPTWKLTYSVVPQPGGNTTGTDGFPYEAYQLAPRTQTCIVAQTVIFAEHGPPVVLYIVGPEPELLVYIPKPRTAVALRETDPAPEAPRTAGPAPGHGDAGMHFVRGHASRGDKAANSEGEQN
eukprot:3245627-Lingulodinium_polyedra.AAC.1